MNIRVLGAFGSEGPGQRPSAFLVNDRTLVDAGSVSGGGLNHEFIQEARYSRGFGSVVGARLEYSLTRSLSLTTELTAMRNRMMTYRLIGPANAPNGSTYWMTTFRYSLGLKFNPVRALYLAQNPRL